MAVTFVMRITFLLLLAVAYGLAEGAPPMAYGLGMNSFVHK